MNQNEALPRLEGLQRAGFVAAGLGVIGMLIILVAAGTDSFFQAYLMAYLFCLGLGLGCFAWLMIHHLSGGAWGFAIRRILEAGAMTLPLLAVLFLPIIVGMGSLFIWTNPEYVAADHLLQHKEPYLNTGAFMLRAIIYFVIWAGFAYLLWTWSREQDEAPDGDFRPAVRMRYLSGLGIVLFVITLTFASVDWGMSVEPHFYSTMYGVLFMVGYGLTALAFIVLLLARISDAKPFSEVLGITRIHAIAKLMFAFVVLWAYVSYGQYVIIWSGNLPEFTPWYIHRTEMGWGLIALLLIIFHFAVPFFILLSRRLKQTISQLWVVAALILVMRMVDVFWLIAPDFYTEGFSIGALLTYVVAVVGLGGIWLSGFVWLIKQRPLVPQNDLRNDPRAQKGHAHAAS
jgi:hypothetical protein